FAGRKPGRKAKLDAKDRRIAEREKRNAELERRLHVADVLIDLQKKKRTRFWGSHCRSWTTEMDLVEELDDPCVPISTACNALGLSRATLYRATQLTPPPRMVERGPSARRLSEAER